MAACEKQIRTRLRNDARAFVTIYKIALCRLNSLIRILSPFLIKRDDTPISEVASRHMISWTGGQASKYLFATNDAVTRIRVFINMIQSADCKW